MAGSILWLLHPLPLFISGHSSPSADDPALPRVPILVAHHRQCNNPGISYPVWTGFAAGTHGQAWLQSNPNIIFGCALAALVARV